MYIIEKIVEKKLLQFMLQIHYVALHFFFPPPLVDMPSQIIPETRAQHDREINFPRGVFSAPRVESSVVSIHQSSSFIAGVKNVEPLISPSD